MGRRIESPQGGTTAAPPPLEDLGLTSRGLRRLAIETGIVWLSKKVFLDGEQGKLRISKNGGAAVLPPPGGLQSAAPP